MEEGQPEFTEVTEQHANYTHGKIRKGKKICEAYYLPQANVYVYMKSIK